MRQGFIIGAIVLWVAINILGNIAEKQAWLGQTDSETGETQQDTLESLRSPELTDVNVVTIFTKLGEYLTTFGKVLTLWHPALWQGDAIFIYFFAILPIGLSFWVVLLLAIRGVGSG